MYRNFLDNFTPAISIDDPAKVLGQLDQQSPTSSRKLDYGEIEKKSQNLKFLEQKIRLKMQMNSEIAVVKVFWL